MTTSWPPRQRSSSPEGPTRALLSGVPRRILFVESAFGFGGSVVALARLVRALPRDEFEPRILVRLAVQEEYLRTQLAPDVVVRVVPLARA